MSSTRTAQPGAPFRQERFASSPEFERGLKANLVSLRCELLETPADRELIWWMQKESHTQGGLAALARELCDRHPEAVAAPSLRTMPPTAPLSGSQVWRAMRELEVDESPFNSKFSKARFVAEYDSGRGVAFKASDLNRRARQRLEKELPEIIQLACLDPETWLTNDRPAFFPGLKDALKALMKDRVAQIRKSALTTSVGEPINGLLRYAHKTASAVLIIGQSGIGKTVAVRNWCESHPGAARYCQVPSAGDDISFFREIGKSLGIGISLQAKAQQLRHRIEEVLQKRRLMLVLDEAHYLWPQSNHRETLPTRINWLMTAVVNFGVPVAVVATPQFLSHQGIMEERKLWNGVQLRRRFARSLALPDAPTHEDRLAVAKHLMPGGATKEVELLASVALVSEKRLGAIPMMIQHAKYLAEEDGREQITLTDLAVAANEVRASEKALAATVERQRRKSSRLPAAPQPAAGQDLADVESTPSPAVSRSGGLQDFSPIATSRGLVPAGA